MSDRPTLLKYPEKLAIVRLGPGRRAPAVGRVRHPVLHHRHRDRDQPGVRDPLGADQDPEHQAA